MNPYNLNLLTVQTGKIEQKKTLDRALVNDIKTYKARGFKVTSVHGDI